jgi:non-heme Fe2+,alpha-ketoglutarate-dependent halogenase
VTALTAAERAAFAADGFLAPLDAITASEAAALCADVTRMCGGVDRPPGTALRNNPHLLLRSIADLIRDPRVLDAVETLLGPDLLVWRSTLFGKPPRDSGYVAWHQDVAYWPLRDPCVVTAWIALTDSTRANGCVAVVAGSHRQVMPHRLDAGRENRLLRAQTTAEVRAEQEVAIELAAGQMSLHDGRLLHRSPANPSDRPRIGLAVRFIRPDNRQRGRRPSATLVRGGDAWGHYDHEPMPRFDFDPAARAWHARFLRRYALQVLGEALRRPSLSALRLVTRLASRRDAVFALLPPRRGPHADRRSPP